MGSFNPSDETVPVSHFSNLKLLKQIYAYQIPIK